MLVHVPDVSGLIPFLISLIPVFGFSTSSVYRGGSGYPRHDVSDGDKKSDETNKTNQLKKEVDKLNQEIERLLLILTDEAENEISILLAKRRELIKQRERERDVIRQQMEEIDEELDKSVPEFEKIKAKREKLMKKRLALEAQLRGK